MLIVRHTCECTIVRHEDGTYTENGSPITHCPSCGGPLADDYLYERGRCVKRDDDEPR